MRSHVMEQVRRRLRPLAVAVGAIAIMAVVAVPATMAASPTPAGVPGDAALARFGARHPLLAGTVRADLTVVKRDGTTVLVHYELGHVTAVSQTSITITGRDGKGATFAITSATRVRFNGHPIPLASVKVGDRAAVFGTGSSGDYTAFLVRRLRPGPAV